MYNQKACSAAVCHIFAITRSFNSSSSKAREVILSFHFCISSWIYSRGYFNIRFSFS